MSVRSRGCAIVLLAFLAGVPAFPQRITGSLGGTVRDPSGSIVPGAAIRITNIGTASVLEAKTDRGGRFLVPALLPGQYDIIIEANGFRQLERKGLVLNVDQSVELDFTLALGSAAERIEVSGEAPLLEASTSELGHVINNQNIVNLPLNQRNPYSLILLAPGVSGSVGNNITGLQFNVNGGRSGTTDVLLDGVSSTAMTDGYNGLTVFPSVDAVQEFKVQTSNYSAEFGRSGGGIINVLYKSGTNTFHGSAYEFLRNSVMDANNFFANRQGQPLGSFKRSQFGFSLGGPVVVPKLYNGRNKTFFFASYEGLRQRSASNLLTTVSTAAERNGDFSQVKTASGALITIYDPASTALVGSTYMRQAFPGNSIPLNRIDAVAANIRQYWPLPNTPGAAGGQVNNFFASGAAPYTMDQSDLKGDHIFSDRQRMSIRWSRRYNNLSSPAIFFPADIAIAQNSVSTDYPVIGGAFDYTFTATPTYLLEFRYGVSRVVMRTQPIATGFDPTQLGFPSYIRAQANALNFPGIAPAGYSKIGGVSQASQGWLGEVTHTWSLANTKILSHHTLKFGAETRLLVNNTNQVGRSCGDYAFATSFTQGPNALTASNTAGDGFASFLLGLGSGTLTHNFKIIDTISHYWGFYLQDDWKATSKLTLNLGLRYDLILPRTERHNRQPFFDPAAPSPLAGPSGIVGLRGGYVFPGVNGAPRTQMDANYKDFAPRLGFAYQAARRMAVRGGYGIFFSTQPSESMASVATATGFRTDSPFLGTLDNVTPNNYLSNPLCALTARSTRGCKSHLRRNRYA